jgi:hypothetical protein
MLIMIAFCKLCNCRTVHWNSGKCILCRKKYYNLHKESICSSRRKHYRLNIVAELKNSHIWYKAHPGYYKRYYKKNITKIHKRNLDYIHNLKREVLCAYSSNVPKCCWKDCHISDLDLLVLDHIANNGNKERKRLDLRGSVAFYLHLKRHNYPKGYQVLCHNHNYLKELNRRRGII